MNGLPSPHPMCVVHPGVASAPAASPPTSALAVSTHKESSGSGLLLPTPYTAFPVPDRTLYVLLLSFSAANSHCGLTLDSPLGHCCWEYILGCLYPSVSYTLGASPGWQPRRGLPRPCAPCVCIWQGSVSGNIRNHWRGRKREVLSNSTNVWCLRSQEKTNAHQMFTILICNICIFQVPIFLPLNWD